MNPHRLARLVTDEARDELRDVVGRGHACEADLLDAVVAAVLDGAGRAGVLPDPAEPDWAPGDVAADEAGALWQRTPGNDAWALLTTSGAQPQHEPAKPLTPLARDNKPWA